MWNDLPADVVDFRSLQSFRKPLVLLTCPNTSVIHIRNLPSYHCLPIDVCCIITYIGLVVFIVRITVSAIYIAL